MWSGVALHIAAKHLLRPSDALCEANMLAVPNLSVRMSEITAAVMRPLIKNLPERVVEYNRKYQLVTATDECRKCFFPQLDSVTFE